jgi:predicted Na+-dependent transporter
MEFVLKFDVPQVLNLVLSVVFPLVVGLVTTKVTSGALKAILLATIALGSGFISALLAAYLAGAAFDWVGALVVGVTAWLIAIGTHFGFWRPTGVTDKLQAVGAGKHVAE